MASPELASCQTTLAFLRSAFIVERDDIGDYSREDHALALGFRAIASAHIEDYVEKRCSDVARQGANRFLSSQPTRTGRAILTWYGTRKTQRWPIPLKESECVPDRLRVEQALKAYLDSVKNTHGMSGKDARELVVPLGVQEPDLDDLLFSRMDDYAWERQRAVHISVNRVKSMTEPIAEWNEVSDIMTGLSALDDALQAALEHF
jgi:hypothetical protein